MKKRDEHLDAVKGFAILVVMLGHCIGRNHMNDPYLNDAIMTVQMPLFMMVSGYAAGMGKKERLTARAFAAVQGKRAVTYLLPFFSWVFVVSLVRPLGQMQNPFEQCVLVLFHIDSGLWFLLTLFLIQLLVMLARASADRLCACLKKERNDFFHALIFGCAAAVMYLLCIVWERSGSSFLGPAFVVKYLPFYLIGYFVSRYLKGWMEQLPSPESARRVIWAAWGVCLAAFLALVVCFDLQSSENVRELLTQMCASLLGSFVCFWGVYHLPVTHRYGLSFLGRYTLEIYVLHFRFVDMLGFKDKGLKVYSPQGMAAIFVTFFVMSVLSGGIIFIVKKIPVLDLLLFGRISGAAGKTEKKISG